MLTQGTPPHVKAVKTSFLDMKKPGQAGFENSGSPGRIRTCDTLINSQLRYHCATGEYVLRCLRARKYYTHLFRIMQA